MSMCEKYRYWTLKVFCILDCWIVGLLVYWMVGWLVRQSGLLSTPMIRVYYIYVKGWIFRRNIRAKQKGHFCWSYLRPTLHNADWCSGVVVQVMEWGSMGWNCLQVMERGSTSSSARAEHLSIHPSPSILSLSLPCWWLDHRWHWPLFLSFSFPRFLPSPLCP